MPGLFGLTHPTMTTEAIAAPDVAADTATSEEIANETPEVASPESNEAEQQPQEKSEDDSDKSLKRLQRRVDRVTAARYQAEARAQQLEQQLRQFLEQQPREQEEGKQVTPDEIERIASQKARELVESEQIAKASNAIKTELVKKVGAEGFSEVIATVTEEAGPLADERGRWTPLGEAVAESDDPAGLLIFLKDNPDTAAELQGLTAAQLGRRIARIEAQINAPKAEPQPSKAPKPITPVKGGASTSGEPDPKNTAAWIAWRNKQPQRRY